MATNASTTTASAPRLRRTLTLWDLILYGVIVIQPVAPMSVFGVLSDRGRGHVVTTILIAMVAMLFTAFSYGRMARAYPSAGSAFTYVGQEINPALGYVTGWSMVMDYMLNPMICIVWCSQQAHVFAPGIPYWGWALFFGAVFTFLNIQGIKTSARVNTVLAAAMGAVVAIFFMAAARYIFGNPHDGAAFFTRPFYDPAMWNTKAVLGGDLDCRAQLHRLRRHLHAFGRSGESPPQHSARHRADLLRDRNSFRAGSLCRTTSLARVATVSECGYCLHLRRRPRLETSFRHRRLHAAGGELWLRDGRANRRGPIALRHGAQQGASAIVLRRGRSQAACAAQQCLFRGCDCIGRRVAGEHRPVQLRPRARRC